MRTDEQVNALAKSWGAEPQPAATAAEDGTPAIQVAGVTVFVYRINGKLVVAIDTTDPSEDTPVYYAGEPGEQVGITVQVNYETVYDEPDENDLRLLRKAGG